LTTDRNSIGANDIPDDDDTLFDDEEGVEVEAVEEIDQPGLFDDDDVPVSTAPTPRPKRGRPKSGNTPATKSVYFSDADFLADFSSLCERSSSFSSVVQQLAAGFLKAYREAEAKTPDGEVPVVVEVNVKVRC
jgi:hypothetical protein